MEEDEKGGVGKGGIARVDGRKDGGRRGWR